jgi:hypothetical protein
MTAKLLPKTERLIARSASPHELSDFAQWLLSERYSPDPIHLHLIYVEQALAALGAPDDLGVRVLADVERAFDPGGGPLTRIQLFEGRRRAYVRFLRARNRLIEPKAEDRFASLRLEYAQRLIELRGLSASTRSHHAQTVADFLVRGVGSRSLGKLTQRDIERSSCCAGESSRGSRCSTWLRTCARSCASAMSAAISARASTR